MASFRRAASAFQAFQSQRQLHFRERPEQAFSARDEANIYHVPRNFNAKEGTRLTDELVVGKHLSSGLQGGVYLVNDNQGKETDFVVKVCWPQRSALGSITLSQLRL